MINSCGFFRKADKIRYARVNSSGTVLDSCGISSVTVNGTGDYTVNFEDPASSANYAVLVSVHTTSVGSSAVVDNETTNSVDVFTATSGNSPANRAFSITIIEEC